MAWNLTRMWPRTTGTPPQTLSYTAAPAAPGSALVALVGQTQGTAVDPLSVTVSDNLGGAWTQATDSDGQPILVGGGTSTRFAIFGRLDAGGVTVVTVNTSGSSLSAFVAEFSGGPTSGVPTWVAIGGTTANGLTYPPMTVQAPANSLVIGGAMLGVTNRTVAADATYTLLPDGDYKTTGKHLVGVYRIVGDAPEATGPTWTVASSNSSLNTITAALVGGEAPTPLAVDVGTDQAVGAEDGLPLTATVSGGAGARTYAWTIRSGPEGDAQFVDAIGQSTTFDPSGNPGVYVLRCTVTDSTGTAYDELTVTVLRTLAYQPFAALTDTTGWTVTGAATAAAALSDSDDGSYVTSQDGPTGQVLGGTLPALAVPDQPVVLRGQVRAPAATTGTVVGRLYTGATLRATSTEIPVTVGEDTFAQVDVTFPLSTLTAITEAAWQSGVRATLAFTAS